MSGILGAPLGVGGFAQSHHAYSRGQAVAIAMITSPPVVRMVMISRMVKRSAPKASPKIADRLGELRAAHATTGRNLSVVKELSQLGHCRGRTT